jgi:hypothetical protein
LRYKPNSIIIPKEITDHERRLVACLLREAADNELERAERAAREDCHEEAKHAESAWRALGALAEQVSAHDKAKP